MSVIVTDAGFAPEDWTQPVVPLAEALDGNATAVDLASTDDPEALAPHLDRLALIRVTFGSFSDGRGFTLARRLRARGHVIADQYAMARRSGFDEVEIADDLAARQPEAQWQFRADWKAHDYQSRLRG